MQRMRKRERERDPPQPREERQHEHRGLEPRHPSSVLTPGGEWDLLGLSGGAGNWDTWILIVTLSHPLVPCEELFQPERAPLETESQ